MITTKNKKILNHHFCPLLADCLLSTIEATPDTESFRLFCESIQIQENVTFLNDAYQFRVALGDFKKNWRIAGKKEEAFRLANHLWDNYFAPEAPFPVNIDSKTAKQIKEQIEKKELSEDIFESAEDSILHLLLTDAMMKYEDWTVERGELTPSQRKSLASQLYQFCEAADFEEVSKLLEHKLRNLFVNIPNENNESVLFPVCRQGSHKLLILLLNTWQIDLNRQNNDDKRTALHYASMNGFALCIVALLQAGANPFLQNSYKLLARQDTGKQASIDAFHDFESKSESELFAQYTFLTQLEKLTHKAESGETKKSKRNSLTYAVKRFSLPSSFSSSRDSTGELGSEGDKEKKEDKDAKPRLSRKANRKSEHLPKPVNPDVAPTTEPSVRFAEPAPEIAEKKYRRRSLPKPLENPKENG